MQSNKQPFKIYTKGLPHDKGVKDTIYEFDFTPLFTNLGADTGYYRITIPAIAINKEQEYAEFKEQEEFIYGLYLPHLDGWCCSIDLKEQYLNEFLNELKKIEYKK